MFCLLWIRMHDASYMDRKIATNSFAAWILASRPKTLAAAAAPVGVACALAYSCGFFSLAPALLCLLFAVVMQVDANFINDLFDCLKGGDREGRLGPDRACAKGWITPGAMGRAIACTTAAACLVGCAILFYGDLRLVAVGVLCVVFAFLYTAGPYPLSYNAGGDVLVLVFFGVVPVCCTYYVMAGSVSLAAVVSGLACGFAVDSLLVVNNFRDMRQDAANGKRTLVVLLGARGGAALYLATGGAAWLLSFAFMLLGKPCVPLFACVYFAAHVGAWRNMRKIGEGRGLNRVLAETSRNILIFAASMSAGFILG